MTYTATLNTSNKNTINYVEEEEEKRKKEENKRHKNKTRTNFSLKTSQHTNIAIIKQSKTNSKQVFRKKREREGERENYKIILTNKGKRQNNDYLTT